MSYYALSSIDSLNNTGWTIVGATPYYAFDSTDSGNNTGWVFLATPGTGTGRGRNSISNSIGIM